MNPTLTDLLSSYEKLDELSRKIIDQLSLKFTGIDRYSNSQYLNDLNNTTIPYWEIDKLEKKLTKLGLLTCLNVPIELKLELFPKLIKQDKYLKLILKAQAESQKYSWSYSRSDDLRDLLYAVFVEDNDYTPLPLARICNSFHEHFSFFLLLLHYPAYDKVILHSPVLFTTAMQAMLRYNCFHFQSFNHVLNFIERNNELVSNSKQLAIIQAEISLQKGHLPDASQHISLTFNHESLLLHAQTALFSGDYKKSISYFDNARVTDEFGAKISKVELSFYHEFFYWLNYLFCPEELNLKKLDTFIRKAEKGGLQNYQLLLSLLTFIRKDYALAKTHVERFNYQFPNFSPYIHILMCYVVEAKLNDKMIDISHEICENLNRSKQWLFLRELIFVMEKLGIPVKIELPKHLTSPDAAPCLMSRINRQEKWENDLDGLMILFAGNSPSALKETSTSRVCYLVDLDNRYIQPVMQTFGVKNGWSSGRNISLKRLKEHQVDCMTEQDHKVAASISHTSSYYSPSQYSMDTDKAIAELCGHPLLFLMSNPLVSVEIIKSQPELFTEETKKGIHLKTNIPKTDQKIILLKETQTRYQQITLSSEQLRAVKIINQGVFIPASGKAKLLKAVSHLSGIMTVHSDMAESSSLATTIEADARIRVQIIPIGDGLKAEMFVKPLDSTPPYMKPGKGGKVVYGMLDGQKCQAVRKMTNETDHANTISNALALQLEADLIEEAIIFSDPYQCLNLLETLNSHADIAIIEWPEGERFKLKKSASFANLNLRIKGKGQWFELEGELNIDDATILTIKELIELTRKSKGRFLELKKGEFLALTDELKKQIDELENCAIVDKNGVTINQFASHAIQGLTDQAASFKTDKHWKEFQHKIKNSASSEVSIPSALDADLRPYQEDGFRWMTRLKLWNAGACLADDMGLGKTVQAIAMMLHLAEAGPALVVCPASVVPNWGNELRKFAPSLNIHILKTGNREETFDSIGAFDVLVITYGLLQTEEERIAKTQWSMVVLDEAHAIKNYQTKSSKAAMNINAGFKLALTGTPIQNHLGELWNLFQFCNPGLLGTLNHFTERYVKNDLPSQKSHLKKLITPFILRRTKNKVLDELPPKTEITVSVELSKQEMAFYETLRREAIDTLENSSGPGGQQHLQALAEITKLRLACCNSSLVNKKIKLPSAKLEAFFGIIEELRANNHRALVFSQFVMHLAIVREALDQQGITYQYLDGSTSIPDREKAVKAFQSGKGELFLISLKAGGLGLNLTAADYVLHLDPWWNPAIEDQASDRAHRIGQTRPVTIYRLVARNTIEEKIVQLHATKRDLADNLLEGTDQSARLTTVDLLNLLKEV